MEEARKFYPINEKPAFRKKMLDALNDIRFSLCAWKIVGGPFIPKTQLKDIINNTIDRNEKFKAVEDALNKFFGPYFPAKNSNSLDEGQNERSIAEDSEGQNVRGVAKVLTNGHFNSSNNSDAA